MYCKRCGTKLADGEIFCENCGAAVNEKVTIPDNPSGWLVFFSFLCPVLGWFVNLSFRDIQPHKARLCNVAAFVGLILWGLIYILPKLKYLF